MSQQDAGPEIFQTRPTLSPTRTGEDEAIDPSNFYIFGDLQHDRDRLRAQARLFGDYIQHNAHSLLQTRPGRILDLGCGEGQITATFGKLFRGAHITGIDIDAQAITSATTRLKRTPGIVAKQIEFVVGDIEEALPSGPYDLIYASLIFLHLENVEKTLQLCFDNLKPGGILWIKEAGAFPPTPQHPTLERWVELTQCAMTKMGRKLMIASDLPGMLARVGFILTREVAEKYEMKDTDFNGQIMESIALASCYNSIPVLSEIENVPIEELLTMHEQLRTEFDALAITVKLPNILARRPTDEDLLAVDVEEDNSF